MGSRVPSGLVALDELVVLIIDGVLGRANTGGGEQLLIGGDGECD